MTEPSPPPAAQAAPPPPPPPKAPTIGGRWRTIVMLGTGLAAGVLAWVGIDRFGDAVPIAADVRPLLDKPGLSAEEDVRLKKAELVRTYQNTSLSVAIFGGVVGGLLAAAAGLLRRSAGMAVVGLICGALLGGGLGAAGGFADAFAYDKLRQPAGDPNSAPGLDPTFDAMIMHTAAFAIAGLGIGLAAGVASRNVLKTAGVVIAAGVIAGLLYPGLAAAIFPVANSDQPVPAGGIGPVLLWTVLPAGLMGLAVGRTPPKPAKV